MARSLALYNPTGQVGLGQNPFGKDVANLELYQALARHGRYDPLLIVSHGQATAAQLAEAFCPQGDAASRLMGAHIAQQPLIARTGALLRGFPRLTDLAWLRRRAQGDAAYSLLGLIHTVAPPAIRQEIAMHAVAPLQPWDALICTSPSVQSAMTTLFDAWGEHVAARVGGGGPIVRPHLPLVPLGVDAARFAAFADRPAVRAARRAAFGLGETDILILWVGRLSFFEKAFPQAMLQAAQAAARTAGGKVCFVQAGWFPKADNAAQYEAAAKAYAPDVQVEIFDGNDRAGLGELWAAADIFISLVDNIQETFGITPVEAMAAGLPVVASDWDGYRYTVRDGQEGFLIPTLGGPADGVGARMAAPHQLLLESYQTYVGAIAQHTAVHVGRAADALRALIASPDLRRRMGAAGRARVAQMFDWPVVVAGYDALVDELAAIRAAGAAGAAPAGGLDPSRGDPFQDFAGFATTVLDDNTPLRIANGATAAQLSATADLELDRTYGGYRATLDECLAAFALIERGAASSVGAVLAQMTPQRRPALQLGLAWMCKRGLLDWL